MELQNKEVQTIPSYEIAEMMGIDHKILLRMLNGRKGTEKTKEVIGILTTLRKNQMVLSNYFIESTYKVEGNRKTNK